VSTPDSSDTHFFNSFSVVLGILIAFTIVLFAFARVIGRDYQTAEQFEDPLIQTATQQNTMPFGHEAIAGQNNAGPAPAGAPGASPAAGATAVPASGEDAFKQVCSACHATGVNGAPKVGDHAAWGPRIAQGKDTLYAHVIAGKGNMPPKGGTDWPDATIRMAVDYIVSLNK
jgi:cytochrome c5